MFIEWPCVHDSPMCIQTGLSVLSTEADSLHYLSIDGLLSAVQEGMDKTKPYGHCTACLDGQYPVTPEW